MNPQPEELRSRTKAFAIRIIKLSDALPKSATARVIGNQLLRSGTSVGANYRAAGRGRSRAEFAAKMGIVVEEIDETQYWLELLVEAKIVRMDRLVPLMAEASELAAIFTSARHTAARRQ